MDQPIQAPPDRAQTLFALRQLLESFATVPLTVTVQSPYGTSTFPIPALPFGSPESGASPWPDPPRLSPMESCLLGAAAERGIALPGEELAKLAGYGYTSACRQALASLRRRGLLGGGEHASGYPITLAGRQAVSS